MEYRGAEIEWGQCTVLVPSVSIGSVSQLLVDLVVSTLAMRPLGTLHHPALLPLVGRADFAPNSQLLTPLQAYYSEAHRLVVLQQRSDGVKTLREQFKADLLEWISSRGFARTICVCGSDAAQRIDAQIAQPNTIRYLLTPKAAESLATRFEELGWTELERHEPSPSNPDGIFISGGGMARTLHQAAAERDLDFVTIIYFCSEGDNTASAFRLGSILNQWLQLAPPAAEDPAGFAVRWVPPPSWHLMAGPAIHPALF